MAFQITLALTLRLTLAGCWIHPRRVMTHAARGAMLSPQERKDERKRSP
jgi:hypothetical protein